MTAHAVTRPTLRSLNAAIPCIDRCGHCQTRYADDTDRVTGQALLRCRCGVRLVPITRLPATVRKRKARPMQVIVCLYCGRTASVTIDSHSGCCMDADCRAQQCGENARGQRRMPMLNVRRGA